MTIQIGENPEGRKGINKYIEINGEGWRGRIVAFNKDFTQAILRGDSRDNLILVKEQKPTEYPQAVRSIIKIPKGFHLIRRVAKKKKMRA